MDRKIKILTGVIGKGQGGMSRFAVGTFKRLNLDLFDVTFLSNDPEPYFGEEIKSHGGHIACIAPRSANPLKHRRDILRVMREGNFDICHVHLSTASNIDPLIMAKKAGIPMIIGHSHTASVEGSRIAGLLHRINAPKIRRYTTKRLACSGLAGRFMFGDADFTVVKNAIDLDRFAFSPDDRRAVREKYGLEGRFVLGHVGRIAAIKNPRFLLETFCALHRLEPESALLYVGSGELEAETRAYARELGIEKDCVFTGQVPDPQRYFCAMDSFILPSLYEGLGFVVIEAACSGLPCFASDVIPEEARVTDLVETFPLDIDKEALARRILARRNEGQRTSRVEELTALGYDADSQIRQMEAIYLDRES